MRSLQSYLDEYRAHHRNPVNEWIHYLCVPLITFTSLAMLWLVPLGRWLGLPETIAPYVNASTLLALPIFVFYLRLSLKGAVLMALWFAATVAGILAMQAAGWSVLDVSATAWLLAWVAQLYGHKLEGHKPSFFGDLLFLLIGPLFVNDRLVLRLAR